MHANLTYLSASAVAERWGFSTWTIANWARHGRIRGAQRVGRAWRIPLDAELLDPVLPTRATLAISLAEIDRLTDDMKQGRQGRRR